MRPNEVNTEVQYDCKVRRQAVIFLYTEVLNMRKNLTEIVFILDRSGSMSGLEADTIGGFNSMIEKQKKGKQKMYAAYNTALGYEMQDSIDTALEWALKAQTLAREKSKTDKKETGEIHDGTISYYIFISMYVDELEKRKEGMARLNMQMNRFDDDF